MPKKSELVAKVKEIDAEEIIRVAIKIPLVKIDRQKYLHKELIKRYPEDIVGIAIKENPAKAGIKREIIDDISKHMINYETNKVSAVSFASGIPGGLAMAATIPADIAAYFGFVLRVLQKLAYLYGFPDFELDEDNIDDATMNQILIFLGVMFGVQTANTVIVKMAETLSQKVSKALVSKALTKGTVYPIVKKIAQALGVKMTKQIFANGVSKTIPVIGGVINGTVSYVSFKPCSKKLKQCLRELPISNPEFYKGGN